jgi:arsenate reductase-like glutaredoxin family protein
MEVQIFGTKKSAATRAALRFFAERRVKTHFVDLTVRPAAPGELRRFAERFGTAAIVDRESKSYAALGLRTAALSDKGWLDKLAAEPLLLRQPLVRWGKELTVGEADATWRAWMQRES